MLDLIRQGLMNEEIAHRLDISLAGVKYHVSEILSKLGVSSREEAARWQPEETRPWWAAGLAMLGWPVKGLPVGFAAKAAAAGTLVATTAVASALVWSAASGGGPDGGSNLSQLPSPPARRILLFTEAPIWERPDSDFVELGMTVVHSEAELRQAVDSSTRAIILTPETIGKVERDWIWHRGNEGLLLGGISLSRADLLELIGYGQLTPHNQASLGVDLKQAAWRPPGNQAFFSLICGSGGCSTIQVVADSPRSLTSARPLLSHVERLIGDAGNSDRTVRSAREPTASDGGRSNISLPEHLLEGSVTLGEIGDFAPGTVTPFPQYDLFISRLEDGTLVALYNGAQHLPGERVNWLPDFDFGGLSNERPGLFRSPFHGETFDREGRLKAGPAIRDMDQFLVAVVGDKVTVDFAQMTCGEGYYRPEDVCRPGPESSPFPSPRPTPSDISPPPPPSLPPGAVEIRMLPEMRFDRQELRVEAGKDTAIAVINGDSSALHNLSIYKDASYTQRLGTTRICFGPCSELLVVSLSPGTYQFRCDVHPMAMQGTLIAR